MMATLHFALSDARRGGGLAAPVPGVIAVPDAYFVQKAVFAERGLPVAGWKIGLTGDGIRRALGADAPAAGRLAESDFVGSPAAVAIGSGEYYVEGELVFEIGSSLSPSARPFTCAQVAETIRAVHVGIELVTSRFETTELPLDLLIADNCMAYRLVIGDKIADAWEERFSDMAVTLAKGDGSIVQGNSSAVLGSPLIALTWLANWLAGQGMALEPGQRVCSGTCTGVTDVAPGDTVSVDVAGLGGATIVFSWD